MVEPLVLKPQGDEDSSRRRVRIDSERERPTRGYFTVLTYVTDDDTKTLPLDPSTPRPDPPLSQPT